MVLPAMEEVLATSCVVETLVPGAWLTVFCLASGRV